VEIITGVHRIPRVSSNTYLITAPEGLTLIDAGLPGSQRNILRYMRALGYSPTALQHIVITHADIDHFGGLSRLKGATGARVYASAIEAKAMSEGRSSRRFRPRNPVRRFLMGTLGSLFKVAPAEVDIIVEEGYELPALGGLQVLSTSGHTPGHISLYSPSKSLLFTGDSIISPNGKLVRSLPDLTWDEKRADESARRQAALGARIVCSGHGAVVLNALDKFPQL